MRTPTTKKSTEATTTATTEAADRTYVTKKIPGTKVTMQALATPHAHAPKSAPYIFNAEQVTDIATSLSLGLNIMLTGPTGCGKTSVVTALAAQLGRPCIRFNCDGETRVSNLRGMMKPASKDGVLTLTFSPGDLAIAMREGYWVLFDEIDAALPSVLFCLQPVLEEGSRMMHVPETKQTVYAHHDFAIFATGNTIGYRASLRSRHAGTNAMNAAFVDRFGCVIACDYPILDEEVQRVSAHVSTPTMADHIEGICRVGQALRIDDKFKVDLSTRRLIQWARLVEAYQGDVLHTFELAIARKLDNPIDAKISREVVRRIFGYPLDAPSKEVKKSRGSK